MLDGQSSVMNLISKFGLIYDCPSRRSDVDYNKSTSPEAIKGVISLFRQLRDSRATAGWIFNASGDYLSLRPDFKYYRDLILGNYRYDPLSIFQKYLLEPSTEPVAFLDFLETAFKNDAAERDNDFIESINIVLEQNECAYRLTKFVRHKDLAKNYPKVYLASNTTIESYSIKPLRDLFSNPDFVEPRKLFDKIFERYKLEDYSGCVTACATAIEETIKVIAERKNWRIRGNGVGGKLKSFISQSTLPNKLVTVAEYFAERRQNIGDVHSNGAPDETTDAEIRFFISFTAALIVYIADELNT